MYSLPITIKTNTKQNKKIIVEMDAYKFEKMAAIFGLFGKEFIKSLNRAEKDYKAGRVKKIKSLKELSK